MDSSKKLYIALAVLLALGGGLYLQMKNEAKEEATYSYAAKQADLPQVTVDEETRKAIDSVELTRPPADEKADDEEKTDGNSEPPAGESETIVLAKTGEESWELTEPLKYAANASNVKSLIDNLGKLKVSEQISASAADYDKWGLGEGKALHAVFKKGDTVVADLYFGDTGSRGQMVRIGGKDGVYALKGYSQYLYSRDVKGWRDKTVLKFDDTAVEKVTIQNDNGIFEFVKGDTWKATHKKADGTAGKDIERFKPSKVDDLVRAYKSLNAADFADGKTLSEVGLEKPTATVTIELKGGSAKHVISVGDNSEGTSRWLKTNASDQIFSVSSWTVDWATADATKFQEKDEKAEAAEGSEGVPADVEASAAAPHP